MKFLHRFFGSFSFNNLHFADDFAFIVENLAIFIGRFTNALFEVGFLGEFTNDFSVVIQDIAFLIDSSTIKNGNIRFDFRNGFFKSFGAFFHLIYGVLGNNFCSANHVTLLVKNFTFLIQRLAN